MAILNVTPDSFFEPSRAMTVERAVERGIQLAHEGADILDIGGESSRPSAEPVSEEEEIERVIPVVKALVPKLHIPISIDTVKPKVAELALKAGASFINDISGLQDPAMRKVVKKAGCNVCVMHMLGSPKTMQLNPAYDKGVVTDVIEWLDQQVKMLLHEGIEQENIILDPGIGFGKTVEDNIAILNQIAEFQKLGYPLLVGISRKSFMAKLLNRAADDLLPATLATNVFLAMANVAYIRVHDVRAHHDALSMLRTLTADSI